MAEPGALIFVDLPALLAHFGMATVDELANEVIDNEVDSYVELFRDDAGEWVLYMTTPNSARHSGMVLEFPMTEADFWEYVQDLDNLVMGEE
jgi:hypothetical protein